MLPGEHNHAVAVLAGDLGEHPTELAGPDDADGCAWQQPGDIGGAHHSALQLYRAHLGRSVRSILSEGFGEGRIVASQ